MSQNDRLETLKYGMRMAMIFPRILPAARWGVTKTLQERARKGPDDLAIAFEDQRFTWRQVNTRANQYAHFFAKRGVGAGDPIAVLMDNRPEFLFALHGLAKLGAIPALINTNLSGAPLVHAVTISGSKRLLAGLEHLQKVEAVQSELDSSIADGGLFVQGDTGPLGVDADIAAAPTTEFERGQTPKGTDRFCYIYTSGTTGLPKAAIITHQRMLAANYIFGHMMHRAERGDVIYVSLPLYHSSALFLGWGAALSTGAAIALRRKFSASNFWEDVRRYQATSFIYIGELCRYLLNSPPREGERDHKLKVGVGNGLRPDIWEAFQDRFDVPVIREFYGATEGNTPAVNFQGRVGMIGKLGIGQIVARCDAETGELIRNAQGLAQSVSVGEVGLLLGRINRFVGFDGYVDKKASSKKVAENVQRKGDRYFDTGDLVQLHEGKWLSFADRVGDTFRWKGENVSTNEVAEVLNGAPGVLEANVYGVRVPHADGRAGMAALDINSDFELDAFGSYVQENLPGYQRPLFVRLLKEQMQATGTFKQQKVRYRNEGFDVSVINDPVYFFDGERFTAVDADLLSTLESGEVDL